MALSEQDRREIKATFGQSLAEHTQEMCEAIRKIGKEQIEQHVKSCPHGINMRASKAFLVGMIVASGAAGSASTAAVLKFLMG